MIRPEPLAGYLAGLGLIRVLAEQADPGLTACWSEDGLVLTTSVEDIAAWLARDYVPTPLVSPWNNGSGFGAKDKEPLRTLDAILKHPSPRFGGLMESIRIARDVAGSTHKDKASLVMAFRNRCPDSVLPWIDACVVLADRDTFFPPLLGTGGNDGRLDFSTNFHQRLLDVIETRRSLPLARDLLAGTENEQLAKAAIGQFDPASAGGPGSSKFGAADSLVNPWGYVLFVEGALMFAASAARRHQFAAGRAAIPFTVSPSPDGSGSGAAGEESRGELWAPLWTREFSYPEIRQLFTEARASWRGRQARRATDFYAATRTLGVARGVDAFTRFGLQRRNGLAFAAIPLARVEVRENTDVVLAADLEDWAGRLVTDVPGAVGQAARRFQRAHLEYVRGGGPEGLVRMLAAITDLELAAGRSGRARGSTTVRRPAHAGKFLPVLDRDAPPELRVAMGLASVAWRGPDDKWRSLRHLLLPIDPNGRWTPSPVIPGLGVRDVVPVLADVLIWWSRAERSEKDQKEFRGVPGFRYGVEVPPGDLHDFAAGRLDDGKVNRYVRACLALNWAGVRPHWSAGRPDIPVPTLGLLQLLAAGLRGSEDSDEPRRALAPDWAARLLAGQVSAVHRDASRWFEHAVPAPGGQPGHDGMRIAAALVPRCMNPCKYVQPVVAWTPSKERS